MFTFWLLRCATGLFPQLQLCILTVVGSRPLQAGSAAQKAYRALKLKKIEHAGRSRYFLTFWPLRCATGQFPQLQAVSATQKA